MMLAASSESGSSQYLLARTNMASASLICKTISSPLNNSKIIIFGLRAEYNMIFCFSKTCVHAM